MRKATYCPWCKEEFDFSIPVNDTEDTLPKDGDVGMCFECSKWWVMRKGEMKKERNPSLAHILRMEGYLKSYLGRN